MFRQLKEDPCLSASFDKLKHREKTFLEFRGATESISGASAHASLAALAAVKQGIETTRDAHRQIKEGAPVSPEAVLDLLANFEESLKKSIAAPLKDAVNHAALSFRAISTLRKNLSVVSSSTKAVIEKKKPKDRFFFGNPESEVNARFNQDFMEYNSKPSSSSSSSFASRRGGFGSFNKARFLQQKRTPSSSHSASSSTPSSSAYSSSKSSSSTFKKLAFRRGGPSKTSK